MILKLMFVFVFRLVFKVVYCGIRFDGNWDWNWGLVRLLLLFRFFWIEFGLLRFVLFLFCV